MGQVAGMAAHVDALPRRVGERRAGQPAPARVAGDRRRRVAGEPEPMRGDVRLARDDQAAIGPAQPALEARVALARQVRRVRNEDGAIPGEPLVGEVGLLHDVVLEVAAGEQDARGVGREIREFTLEPGAWAPPGVGERIGLPASGGLGSVGIATSPAEQHRDRMPSRPEPSRHSG